MDTRRITATELARNTREVLDAVAARGEVVIVERNRAPIARIAPAERTMTAAQALAGLRPTLTRRQAQDWLRESRGSFGEELRDPWA
ncbi:MAG: type II toxin-antitoxin system Phd/YefM family antitoxin [Burkholderiaceae bacterium]|nr:type II toxin-antitoxin system Phd/YefM family antitoxin [Burkholderiaceae bacterium]